MSRGFWINMTADERHHILINGEPVGELDFSSTAVRIASLQAGFPLPDGLDPYSIDERLGVPREAVKAIVSAMLWDTAERRNVPREVTKKLGRKVNWKPIRSAIFAAIPSAEGIFGKGLGPRLDYLESSIIVDAMSAALRGGVVCLPVHDCLLCPVSRVDQVRGHMEDACLKWLGGTLPIKRRW